MDLFDNSRLLDGAVALITGSTSGVGLATARSFARAGAALVVMNGRNAELGAAKASELREENPRTAIEFIRADMSLGEDIEQLFNQVRERGGGLDVFVHCGYGAGIMPDLFEKMSPAQSAALISAIFGSLVTCCCYAVPLLRDRGGGAIIGVTSDAAKVPTAGEAVHGGALAGSVMFLRTLAREVGRYKIRCNAVTPSLIADTRGYEHVMAAEFSRKLFEKIERRAHLGLPIPQDLANLITFLASPLSAKIIGQVISVNGGISGA